MGWTRPDEIGPFLVLVCTVYGFFFGLQATYGLYRIALTGSGLFEDGLNSPVKINLEVLGPSHKFYLGWWTDPYGLTNFEGSNFKSLALHR